MYYGLLIFLFSCSGGQKEHKNQAESASSDMELLFPPAPVHKTLEAIKLQEGRTCTHFFLQQQTPYYVTKSERGIGLLSTAEKAILPLEYHKIYNPGLTHDGCVEVKKDGLVGLFHIASETLLPPQFEYIAPKNTSDHSSSFGFKNDSFFQITFKDKVFEMSNASYSQAQSLIGLDILVQDIGNSMVYSASTAIYRGDGNEGNGIVFLPTYLEHFGIWPAEIDQLIAPQLQAFEIRFGRKTSRLKASKPSVLGEMTAFIVEQYEEFWDARSSIHQSGSIVTLNSQTDEHQRLELINTTATYASTYSIEFVQNNLIQFRTEVDKKGGYYDVETAYQYYQIDSTGSIAYLDLPRHFDLTHFVRLTDAYFQGFYGNYLSAEEHTYPTLRGQKHLSIHDLDVMRNEIYAEYGYRFKGEEWREYFAQFDWYQPKYDNVDERLTELEKENIQTILAMKGRMLDDEASFLQKADTTYHWEP